MAARRALAALVFWAFVWLGSAAPAAASQPHVLRFAEGIDVTTLNPFLATSGNVTDLSGLTMAYFVRYDAQRRPVPELITELPTERNGGISADGRAITYHLRHGVRWSDGAPFDADDVAYTLRVIADRSNLSRSMTPGTESRGSTNRISLRSSFIWIGRTHPLSQATSQVTR